MTVCRVCLEPTAEPGTDHPKCLRGLFGVGRPPRLDIDIAKLHTAAQAMVGHTSLSGVQKKISLGLDAKKAALRVVAEGGGYILKPQTGTYPAVPENEHVTTLMARRVGVETAASGLVQLTDGTLAYIARRFDRRPTGEKLHQEDFCQLAGEPPKNKYQGSAERCAKIVRRFASEPLIELLKLYRLLLFAWWTGNGDMHLKNFSLLTAEDGVVRLTPAYDLVSTHLVIPDDPLALTVNGKDQKLARGDWLRLAEHVGLPKKPAERVIAEQAEATPECLDLIGRSFLPSEHRVAYAELVRARTEALGSGEARSR